MTDDGLIYEEDKAEGAVDPDEVPISRRRLLTQPFDTQVRSLMDQIEEGSIFLRPVLDEINDGSISPPPVSVRSGFQRRYVWNDAMASKLIESILVNVPIPACYLAQNEDYQLDVIDGQQRLFSIYRFNKNRFAIRELEILVELNGKRFFELPTKLQRQIEQYTLRCIVITSDSDDEIKFDVFERLNKNTVPLNAQELRNCVYRGALNNLLAKAVEYPPWLEILKRKSPDNRMRDEELTLRFFAFHLTGIDKYRTPQKLWLNDTAKAGMKYSDAAIGELYDVWTNAITCALCWFAPSECFRRVGETRSRPINRALFDLVMLSAASLRPEDARRVREGVRRQYSALLQDEDFADLISRAVDHKKRTKRRFEMWSATVGKELP